MFGSFWSTVISVFLMLQFIDFVKHMFLRIPLDEKERVRLELFEFFGGIHIAEVYSRRFVKYAQRKIFSKCDVCGHNTLYVCPALVLKYNVLLVNILALIPGMTRYKLYYCISPNCWSEPYYQPPHEI